MIVTVTQTPPAPVAIPEGHTCGEVRECEIVDTIFPDFGSTRQTVPASAPFHHTASSPTATSVSVEEFRVLVPFAGAEHDWAAVELAAWIARASQTTLRLLGREADLGTGERDASRLLASASLLVQRVVRVPTEPMLVKAGSEGTLRAADECGLLVFGLSDRWRQEGLGETRLAIARAAACPTLIVRKGLKPGGIAPGRTMTRFTWSLGNSPSLAES